MIRLRFDWQAKNSFEYRVLLGWEERAKEYKARTEKLEGHIKRFTDLVDIMYPSDNYLNLDLILEEEKVDELKELMLDIKEGQYE